MQISSQNLTFDSLDFDDLISWKRKLKNIDQSNSFHLAMIVDG